MWSAIITLTVIAGSAVVLAIAEYRKRHPVDKRRRLDLAMVRIAQQLRRYPNDVRLLTKLGIVKLGKGDLAGALSDLSHALDLDPMLAEAHYHLAVVYEQIGNKSAAEKEFRWILSHSEDHYFRTAASSRLTKLRVA